MKEKIAIEILKIMIESQLRYRRISLWQRIRALFGLRPIVNIDFNGDRSIELACEVADDMVNALGGEKKA